MEAAFSVLNTPSIVLVLSLHAANDPNAQEWARYLECLHRALALESEGNLRNLVVSDGGSPNAARRAEVNELVGARRNKISVITNSLKNPVKRGIVTAFRWVNPDFHAFPPSQVSEALAHLDCSAYSQRIWDELAEMQNKVTPVASLEEANPRFRQLISA